VMMNSSISVFC